MNHSLSLSLSAFVQVPASIYFITVACMQLKFSFNKFHTWTIVIASNLKYDNVHTVSAIAYRSHNTAQMCSHHIQITTNKSEFNTFFWIPAYG